MGAHAVERADCACLARGGFVRGRVGVQVVQDVQLGEHVFVLRKIEQRAVRAFDLFQPGVGIGFLRRGGADAAK